MTTDWKKEYDHIVSIDYRNPGSDFNYDTQCFKRYCKRQAKGMLKAGHTNMAKDIETFINSIKE